MRCTAGLRVTRCNTPFESEILWFMVTRIIYAAYAVKISRHQPKSFLRSLSEEVAQAWRSLALVAA